MAKILTLDIETSPNLGYVWSLWNQNIGLSQLVETGEVISFAAKWHGKKEVLFYSTFHDGKEAMLEAAHKLLSEADLVVHYNGTRFDMPHLNREFLEYDLTPPAPYAQVDLLRVVKKSFRFPSNKLDYVAQRLRVGAKTQHTGFQLWWDCMRGNKKAWTLMRKYNKQDVVITEKVYDALLPWIHSHPPVNLIDGTGPDACPNCGKRNLQKRGRAYTAMSSYQRYQCMDCGKWLRGSKRDEGSQVKGL